MESAAAALHSRRAGEIRPTRQFRPFGRRDRRRRVACRKALGAPEFTLDVPQSSSIILCTRRQRDSSWKERQAIMAMQVTSKKKESFTYFAPGAANVLLAGDFTNWEQNPISLKKQIDGSWKATIPLDPGTHEYRFLVD